MSEAGAAPTPPCAVAPTATEATEKTSLRQELEEVAHSLGQAVPGLRRDGQVETQKAEDPQSSSKEDHPSAEKPRCQ